VSFRSSDPVQRKKYVALVEAVQQKGGEVLIFSSMHESGQRRSWIFFPHYDLLPTLANTELNQLTGIAAILTFPLDIEVVETEEREEEEKRRRNIAEGEAGEGS
jgi:protein pelota